MFYRTGVLPVIGRCYVVNVYEIQVSFLLFKGVLLRRMSYRCLTCDWKVCESV